MGLPLSQESFSASGPLPQEAAVPAILLAGVGKTYPARKGQRPVAALDDVELAVRPGSILGVIGPSGAGKSTLIRLVNGLEQASAGHVALFGEDVTALSEAEWRQQRRRIGMIFQHFNLLSSRTVFDNVALPLEIAGADRKLIEERVTRLLALVGLADKSGRYPAELSGGQKQRVGIARALATEPSILLCDEATSALDPETTKAILALLRRINRELGVTILLITHEIPVIKELCDDVAVIEAGRIVEQGAVFDVFTAPRHPTTERFVEDVTSVEIPASLAEALRPGHEPGAAAVLKIGFLGTNATTPVVSRLTTTLGVDVNIIAGRIDTIGGQPFGTLLVAVPGETAIREAAISALRRLGLRVSITGFLPPSAIEAQPHCPADKAAATAPEAVHVA